MASEVRVNSSLQIRKMSSDGGTVLIDYMSRPNGFVADMAGAFGPVPGAVVALTTGTQITFTGLTRPTFAFVTNLGPSDGADPTAADYFEYGIYDPATHKFYPLGECGPGEQYPIKFSRNLQEIYLGPGTGTAAGGETARLMLLAHGKSINARIDGFEF